MDGKESAYSVGNLVSIHELGRSLERDLLTPIFLPGEFHGQRSLVGYSSWGQNLCRLS